MFQQVLKRENDDRNPHPSLSKSLWGQSKCHHSENLLVTLFWINSPTPSSKKFTIEMKNSDKVSYLRGKIQTQLMSLSKTEIQIIPPNPVKEMDLVTSYGHLLDEADELKSIDYFDLQGDSNVKFYLLSKHCGLLSVFLSRFSKDIPPIRIDLNLANDSLSTVAHIISTTQNIPLSHLVLINNGQIPNKYNGLGVLNQFEKIYFKNDDEICEIVQFNVRTLAGKNYQLEMCTSDLILWVKREIQEIDGIPAIQQSLCLNGKHLFDEYTLKDCGISHGMILHLVLGYPGRGYHGWGDQYDNEKVHRTERTHSIAFVDISNEDLMARRKTFSPPIWRQVSSGLNLHGICGNGNCKAFQKNVICPMGDGIFNLKYDSYKVKCPLCCLTLESIKTCGFTGAYWKYFGRKLSEPEELINSEWSKASSDDYSTFEVTLSPSSTCGLSNWDHLVIQTCQFWNFNKKHNFPHWLYCSICLTNKYEKRGRIKVDPCGHMTHEECLKLAGITEVQMNCAPPCNLCELEKLN